MNDDVGTSEKSAPVALAAHEDARELVRLIQCTQCSRPWRNPVTLPCGNSICRECLPESHEREHISYPDLPGRRRGFQCPLETCVEEHAAPDCNVDVVLSRFMQSIAEIVTKHNSIIDMVPMELKLVKHAEEATENPDHNSQHQFPGGRFIATYMLAAQGGLNYHVDVDYRSSEGAAEADRELDVTVFEEILGSLQKEMDCHVCYNLMLDPVTTFCGHSLCRKCLTRVLDHSPHCPVCRRELSHSPSLSRQPSNKALSRLLARLCPEVVASRAEMVAAEEQAGDGDHNIPLFICTLGFPHQPTFLRIFEPRYRLMLRRCMEGNRQFGMLMYNHYHEPQGDLGPVNFYHYGTMLSIVQAELVHDGTSLVETRGTYRFRVASHNIVDGYLVGDVERLEDVDFAEEERIEAEETSAPSSEGEEDIASQLSRMSTQDLFAIGKTFVEQNQTRSAPWLQQRFLDAYGQPPDDAGLFPYWFANVLPIREDEKYKLLSTRTARERLKITAIWIRRIESSRWYQSSSCRIL